MPVTAGSISVARRINTGDYSHKEAKVELHYTAEGGEDITVLGAQAAHVALVHVAEVLATVVKIDHTPEIHVPAPGAAPEAEVPAPAAAPEAGVPASNEPGKRHRRTKAEMETEMGVPVGVSPAAPALVAVQELKAAQDPMLPFGASGNSAEMPVGGPADVLASPAVNSPNEITDKELNNLCNETMLRIKNKVSIQAVIGEYTPGAVSTIPQSARAAFMQKLQKLQALQL